MMRSSTTQMTAMTRILMLFLYIKQHCISRHCRHALYVLYLLLKLIFSFSLKASSPFVILPISSHHLNFSFIYSIHTTMLSLNIIHPASALNISVRLYIINKNDSQHKDFKLWDLDTLNVRNEY